MSEEDRKSRPRMLERIREAVRAGNRYGAAQEIGPRGQLGYQGSGELGLLEGFAQALQRAGGHFHFAERLLDVPRVIIPILENAGVRRVGLSAEPLLEETLQLATRLKGFDFEVWPGGKDIDEEPAAVKEALFSLDAGITGVDALVAETGTIVISCSRTRPRSLSLLPRLYIALADTGQIVPDLFDWFARVEVAALPAAFTWITGPSKTGDIELTLVTGVHGPGEVHVVVFAR